MGRRSKDNPIDWELVEKEYRKGQCSIRQLATRFNIQPSAISRKISNEGWIQDKSQEVITLSEAQLIKSNNKSNTDKATRKATLKATPDRTDIEIAALARTNLILSHRSDAGRARNLLMVMLGELEHTTSNLDDFERLGTLLIDTAGDDQGDKQSKREELLNRVLSTPSRIKSAKDIVDALKAVTSIEREAFGITEKSDTSININNVVQNNMQGYDLTRLTDEELDHYLAMQEKIEVEVKEVKAIER